MDFFKFKFDLGFLGSLHTVCLLLLGLEQWSGHRHLGFHRLGLVQSVWGLVEDNDQACVGYTCTDVKYVSLLECEELLASYTKFQVKVGRVRSTFLLSFGLVK